MFYISSTYLVVDGVLYTNSPDERFKENLRGQYGYEVRTGDGNTRDEIVYWLKRDNREEAERLFLIAKIRGDL